MWYVMVNGHRIGTPYMKFREAKEALKKVYRTQYPLARLEIIFEK